ncbi:helix-turn-helix domain-containing protein [Brucella sp. TWI432]
MSVDEKSDHETQRTFTGWKLDLCRAVRADHKVGPAPASCFAALMDHVNSETLKAWPSEAALAINLGVSTKTVRKYLAVLIDAKWIKVEGRSNRGTIIYLVQGYRMNAVLDQVAIQIERHRDAERERQSKRRVQKRTVVTEHGFQPTETPSRNMGSELSRNMGSNEHLHRTPSSKISYEEGNTYRSSSNGW